MIRTAIHLQTFQSLSEDLPETISRVGATALEGVELPEPNGTPTLPVDVAHALEEANLEAVGAHVSLERLRNEWIPGPTDPRYRARTRDPQTHI